MYWYVNKMYLYFWTKSLIKDGQGVIGINILHTAILVDGNPN